MRLTLVALDASCAFSVFTIRLDLDALASALRGDNDPSVSSAGRPCVERGHLLARARPGVEEEELAGSRPVEAEGGPGGAGEVPEE